MTPRFQRGSAAAAPRPDFASGDPPRTAWRAGRLHRRAGPPRLLFGGMVEDAAVERAAFQGCGRVFCIASAGDTALALAAAHDVVACDINPVQLDYLRRRAAGAPAETGDAERALRWVRRLAPLAGWRPAVLRDFLALDDPAAQAQFWRRRLDTRRFRLALDALLSRPVLRALYAPAFLSGIPPHFGAGLRRRLAAGFARHPNASNPYARALLLGDFPAVPPPPPARLSLSLGDAVACLEASPAAAFDAVTLSNILDGATPAYRARLAQAVRHAARPQAPVVWRSFAEPPPGLAALPHANDVGRDRCPVWGVVAVTSASSLRFD